MWISRSSSGFHWRMDSSYFSKEFNLAIAVFIRHRGWSLLEEGDRTKRSCLWSKRWLCWNSVGDLLGRICKGCVDHRSTDSVVWGDLIVESSLASSRERKFDGDLQVARVWNGERRLKLQGNLILLWVTRSFSMIQSRRPKLISCKENAREGRDRCVYEG